MAAASTTESECASTVATAAYTASTLYYSINHLDWCSKKWILSLYVREYS